MEKLAKEILDAIYVSQSQGNIDDVIYVLEGDDDPISKANDICETLGIQKRRNRSTISNILFSIRQEKEGNV